MIQIEASGLKQATLIILKSRIVVKKLAFFIVNFFTMYKFISFFKFYCKM
jgi:hypothetical protein